MPTNVLYRLFIKQRHSHTRPSKYSMYYAIFSQGHPLVRDLRPLKEAGPERMRPAMHLYITHVLYFEIYTTLLAVIQLMSIARYEAYVCVCFFMYKTLCAAFIWLPWDARSYTYNHVFSTLASSSTINNNSHNITIIYRKKYNNRNGLENVQLYKYSMWCIEHSVFGRVCIYCYIYALEMY